MAAVDSKALIYVRYSPRRDEDCESLEFQEEYVRRYFDFVGIEVAEVISDPSTSARLVPLAKREGGSRLLSLTTGKAARHTIVGAYRLDRLWRDIVDGNVTMRAWKKSRTQCHFAAEGGQSINTGTATGRFLVNILLSKAGYEPDLTSERTSDAMRRHMESGRVMGGTLPFGRRESQPVLINGKRRRMMEDDPSEQAVIKRIWSMRAGGLNPHAICVRLNEENVPCRGRKWHPPMVARICKRCG